MRFETIGIAIERPYEVVYEFLADPTNLFRWASVLGTRHHAIGPMEWVAEEPTFIGVPVTIRFTPRNGFGVLDITASAEGKVIYAAPVRLLRHDGGAIITMGVHQRDGDSEEAFQSELEWTRSDILVVKTLLEAQ